MIHKQKRFTVFVPFDTETAKQYKGEEVDVVAYAAGYSFAIYQDWSWPTTDDWKNSPTYLDITKQLKKNLQLEYNKNSAEVFIRWLLNNLPPHKIEIVAHNLSYDEPFILEAAKKLIPGLKVDAKRDQNRNIIHGEWKFRWNNINRKITFVDTLQWDRTISLDNYNRMLGEKTKTTFDPGKRHIIFDKDGKPVWYVNDDDQWVPFDMEQEKTYLKGDVLSIAPIKTYIGVTKEMIIKLLFGSIEKAIERYKKVYPPKTRRQRNIIKYTFLKKLKTTLTKGSFTKFSASLFSLCDFDTNFRQIMHDKKERSKWLKSLLGGFVSGNRYIWEILAKHKKKLIGIDVNSMYPYIMELGLPEGDILNEKPKGDYVTWVEIEGNEYEWKKIYDFFDNEFLGKNFFFTCKGKIVAMRKPGSKSFYLLKEYWELMKQMCDVSKLRVVNSVYQKKGKTLSSYINLLYHEIKQKWTILYNKQIAEWEANGKEGDEPIKPSEINLAKLLLNSLFGKACEKTHDDGYTYDNDIEDWRPFNEEEINELIFRSPTAGCFITQSARLILISSIKKCVDAGHTFLNCDTDSIKLIINNNTTPIEELLRIHDDELGAWKIEYYADTYLYNGKHKKYFFWNSSLPLKKAKYAFSGFGKWWWDLFDFEMVHTLFHKDNNVLMINSKKDNKQVKTNSNGKGESCMKTAIGITHAQFNPAKEGQPKRPITHILYAKTTHKDGKIVKTAHIRCATEKDIEHFKNGDRWVKDNWTTLKEWEIPEWKDPSWHNHGKKI